jgi:putative MATE family efflux protein
MKLEQATDTFTTVSIGDGAATALVSRDPAGRVTANAKVVTGDADAGVQTRSDAAIPQTRGQRAQVRSNGARAAILTGPVLPTLLRLALPTMVVLLAQTAVNIAEAYYVGFLGTDALAGVALVFPVFMLMTMMSNGGLGSGVASSVARAVGAGRKHDADALVFHALILAVIVGALFMLGTIRGGPALYRALGGRNEALDAALKYSNYLFAGAIPVWIVNLQAAALRGSGNVRVPAMVTLVGALVLIPTSPLLIFGFGPIPGWGIAGAGIAFAVYYGGAMLVLLRYMMSGRSGLTFRFVPLQRRLFADILKVGVPTAFNTVLTNLTVILVTGAVGLFGTKALAAYGIASRLDYVMIPILFGICTSVLTMVGVNIGAGQIARAKRIAWTSSLVGLAVTGTIGMSSGRSSRSSPGWCWPRGSAGSRSATSVAEWQCWHSWSPPRLSFTRRSALSRCSQVRSGVPAGLERRHSFRNRPHESGASSALIGLLQPGDVELDHLQHRLHRALRAGAIGAA